jgi:hypothetical protein
MIACSQSVVAFYIYMDGEVCPSRTCQKPAKSLFGSLNLSYNQLTLVIPVCLTGLISWPGVGII